MLNKALEVGLLSIELACLLGNKNCYEIEGITPIFNIINIILEEI